MEKQAHVPYPPPAAHLVHDLSLREAPPPPSLQRRQQVTTAAVLHDEVELAAARHRVRAVQDGHVGHAGGRARGEAAEGGIGRVRALGTACALWAPAAWRLAFSSALPVAVFWASKETP
jgi:hypothetical protein